jgi:G3E family GTPase
LERKGADIYRSKGILAVGGSDDKYVFHGVHMMLQFGSSREGMGKPWAAGERRACRAVFIGKDLDRKELTEGFKSCAVKGEA